MNDCSGSVVFSHSKSPLAYKVLYLHQSRLILQVVLGMIVLSLLERHSISHTLTKLSRGNWMKSFPPYFLFPSG
jgi:hypothetical protein